MLIQDRVHGEQKITEEVILELLKTKPLQRIKQINQSGASHYALKWQNITRYEHCVGVMLLLKIYRASLEEQIAGLLHDVPHTAFSHTVDYLFKSEDHAYHEKFLEKIVLNSEIPSILKKYQLDIDKIINVHNFPLLEKSIPDLCADRIDYFLRHLKADPRFVQIDTNFYLKHLKVYENEFIFDDPEVAFNYSLNYLRANQLSWDSGYETGAFMLMAQALRIALDKGIITEEDLFKTDQELFDKLKLSAQKNIIQRLDLLNVSLKIIEDKENFQIHVKGKLRYIDPKILVKGELKRVSEVFPDYLNYLKDNKERAKEGHYLRIINFNNA